MSRKGGRKGGRVDGELRDRERGGKGGEGKATRVKGEKWYAWWGLFYGFAYLLRQELTNELSCGRLYELPYRELPQQLARATSTRENGPWTDMRLERYGHVSLSHEAIPDIARRLLFPSST